MSQPKRELSRGAVLSLLSVTIALPVGDPSGWQIDRYSRIAPHETRFAQGELRIHVRRSASPIIRALPGGPLKITGFKVEGEFKGLPVFANVKKQGQKGADDFALRLGFIVPGDKKLSGLKKTFAPEWIKRLYEKVPEGSGIDHVRFFALVQNPELVGQSRRHPASELLREDFVAHVRAPGPFTFTHQLAEPLQAGAIWLSTDGDDTRSEFTVVIKKIELLTELPAR